MIDEFVNKITKILAVATSNMHENFLNNQVKFPEKAAIRLAATFLRV